MKTIIIIIAVASALSACTSTSKYVNIAGHPYKTELGCNREKPIGKFDVKCDEPRLGFSGFSPDIIVPQVGGFGNSGE